MQRFAVLGTEEGRARLRWMVSRKVSRALYRSGFALLSDHFYQPLPSRAVMVGHRQPCKSVESTIDAQAAFARQILIRYKAELDTKLGSFGYSASVGQLPGVDASMLFAVIRDQKPKRVVEVGSGSSTQVIAAALDVNAREDGRSCEFVSVDPYVVPRIIGALDPKVAFEHLSEHLQSLDRALWAALGPSDVLFIDSSHVFKAGSDVEYQFTQIYPALAAGALVHLHDVFLPNDYPLNWALERFQFWNEQQFLAVMLDNSARYEVVAGLAALFDRDSNFFHELVAGFEGTYSPGSIWLRVRT
jgi:predicted O-methyltransferase YrrM